MTIHRRMIFPFFSLLLLTISPLHVVAQATAEKNWRLFLDFDFLSVGNGNSELRSIADSWCSNNGQSPCIGATNASGASGFRVAAFREYSGIEFGPSVGYLNGGPGTGGIILHITSPLPNALYYRASENTVRFLMEARKSWSLVGDWNVRMGTGLGLASVNQVNSCSDSGSLSGFCSGQNLPPPTMGWLTWELSPAIVYKSMSLGLRYVGFARGGQVPWNTYGAFFGIDF